jgi:type VI secretion system protein ImpC
MSPTQEISTQTAAPELADGGRQVLEELFDSLVPATETDGEAVAIRDRQRDAFDKLIKELIPKSGDQSIRVDDARVDEFVAKIDAILQAQTDKILHDPKFQAIESAWRGLWMLVDRTDFQYPIEIQFINASKDDLIDDFANAPDIRRSGLYWHLYQDNYDQYGRFPFSTIIGNYSFGPSTPDVKLMQKLAKVAKDAHAPFIAAASPAFFKQDSFESLGKELDVNLKLDADITLAKWRAFREEEVSRYFGLTLPRVMLRDPYGEQNPAKSFPYTENVAKHSDYLWGNASFGFAAMLTRSFAESGWYHDIIGPRAGGEVRDLPYTLVESKGRLFQKVHTESLMSSTLDRGLELSGFIPLVAKAETPQAVFFSASSVHKPDTYPNTEEGQRSATNDKLNSQLPYLFILSRLAHFLKVQQINMLGRTLDAVQYQGELTKWLRQYVSDMESPQPEVMRLKPLKEASITVTEIPDDPGWYRVNMSVVPHKKFMGARFDLSLEGRLDRQP